jgi:CheY-like chemotaxis protein
MVQVVVNLLNNAAKYTQEYGHIRVKVAREGAVVRVEVADDGIGMAPELVARVFELFTQAERASDRSQGGLGLGLALARTLVTLHGGSVRAASAGAQQGSTFTVELPHVELPAQALAGGAPAAGGKAARAGMLRCLVVDDNVDAAQTLALFLEAAGHAVHVAHRATEALELARRHAPQLCFLDIGLPDIDGNQLARQLRALPQTAGAQLVAVTGYGRKEDQEKSIAAGFDQYFVKPMDTAKLVQLLALVGPEAVQ